MADVIQESLVLVVLLFFFFQAEDGIRDYKVTGVQTCALPICLDRRRHGVGPAAFLLRWIHLEGPRNSNASDARHRWQRRVDSACATLVAGRSEERRVGEEGRSRWAPYH